MAKARKGARGGKRNTVQTPRSLGGARATKLKSQRKPTRSRGRASGGRGRKHHHTGKVELTLHEWKHGSLHTGSGTVVPRTKKGFQQAVAIGLSQARRKGESVPPPPRR